MSAVTSCENALLVIFRFVWAVKFVLLDYKVANVADGGVTKLLDINSWISLKILRNKCAKFVFRAQWLVTVGSSWEVVGDSSLVQCKTRFVQIFYVFFFIEHIFVDPPPKLVPRSRSVLCRGRSGYEITSPFSLTHSLNYLWIPSVLSQLKLHCSCLKPLVLSNVVQGGSLSASFQDYNCSLRIRPWWANLCGPQSYSQWPSSYLHLPSLPSKYWTLPTEVTFVWLIRFCV